MSYANGKVYVDTSVTPNIGVSVYDVQRALGTSENDVGSLCKHENINKWAKYKPMRLTQLTAITENGRQSVNYGIINIPTWTYLSRMATFLFGDRDSVAANTYPSCGYNNGIIYWDYAKPQGNAASPVSPYRLTDFSEYPVSANMKGYYHLAEAPIRGMATDAIDITPEGVLQIMFPFGTYNVNTLQFSDLTLPDAGSDPISGMYYGLLLKQKSGSGAGRTYVVTQADNIGQISALTPENMVVTIPLTESDATWAGTWNIMPIISKVKIETKTTSLSNYDGQYFVAMLPDHLQDISVTIQRAKAELLNVVAYRVEDSQQPTAYFIITLRNAVNENVSRNYRLFISICDSSGNLITNLSDNPRTFTGTVPANGAVDTPTFAIQISQLTSRQRENLYFKIRTAITGQGVVFKEEDNWQPTISGPIPIGSPTPV